MRKIAILVIAAALLGGCSEITPPENEYTPATEAVTTAATSETEITTAATTAEITSIALIEPQFPEISPADFRTRIEAEGEDFFLSEKEGYSGNGYISGMDSVAFTAELPTAQHYSITICAASDDGGGAEIIINGTSAATLSLTEEFTPVTLSGVFLDSGTLSLTVKETGGSIALDFVEIRSQNVSELTECTADGGLSDENASEGAAALMAIFSESFGKSVFSGQYDTPQTTAETDLIYRESGRYPAIRFSDLSIYSPNGGEINEELPDEIDLALEWAEAGGIVGYMWHWTAPEGVPSVYSDENPFSLTDALAGVDIEEIAALPYEEIAAMAQTGRIPMAAAAIIRDIDAISERLSPLAERDIPVLWRPLHEADGDWFWWGGDSESYLALWRLTYSRMSGYHGLHNLIWVWNGRSSLFYPGDEYCDITSIDIYDGADYGSRLGEYIALNACADGAKPLAIGECGSIPDPDLMLRDGAAWLWFAMWGGEYLLDYEKCNPFSETKVYSEKYLSREQLVKTYNHAAVITRERIPNYQNPIDDN